MATITITIPDDKVARVREAFVAEYGWTPELGVTKAEFAKQQIIKLIKQVVKDSEGNHSANQARSTVDNDVESITIS